MPKQLCYLDEVKPKLKDLFFARLFTFDDREATYLWYERVKAYRSAKNNRKTFIKLGTKYIGHLIKTDITVQENFEGDTEFVYYATIEYINNKGEKIQFKTPELSDNPEYLTTNEVTVYNIDSVHYATNFGFIFIPEE